MLPPVLASANQATTSAKQRPDQAPTTRPTAVFQAMAPAIADQNSAIAGQLNIMLLSGPERMSQNLAALSDILGSALKIDRRIGESVNDYMGRLIEGIAALPVADRVKLQKLLSQAFAGLQLRTLLEAMANPSGPERATLALYLELYRHKDRDGATRSVISSYRELAGEGRSNPLSPGRPPLANDSPRSFAERARPAGSAVSQSPLAASTLPLGNPKPGEGRLTSPTSINDLRPSSAHRQQTPAAVPAGASTQGQERRLDATVIKSVPGFPAARGTSETASPLPSARGQLPLPAPSVGLTGQLHGSAPTSLSGARPADADSDQSRDSSRPSGRPSLAAVPMPPPTGIAGEKPALPQPGGWLAELLETDFVKALLRLKTLPAEQFSAASQAAAPSRTTVVERAATGAAALPPTEEAGQETRISEAGQAPRPADTEPTPTPSPLAEQAAIRSILGREGVPLPFVSYMIEDEIEWEEEVEEEEERETEDRGHPEDEEGSEGAEAPDDAKAPLTAKSDDQDQPADDVATPALPEGHAMPSRALPAPSDTVVQLPPEPAHELYLRMAGLN
ncbi:hypothetical protein LJE98_04805 [Rhizobium ipomoeae]|nr:hypothetical protein [Rhizobium sp. 'Codium 1']